MKTIVRILIATFIMTAFFSTVSASDRGTSRLSTGLVTYSVTVHIPDGAPLMGIYFLVAMTDEHGRLVVPVQMFNPKKLVYNFNEIGPVKGTRVATLIPVPNGDGWMAYIKVPPDAQTGSFAPGSVYYFNLWPYTTRTR